MKAIQIHLEPSEDAPTIPKEIYGQFAEHLGRCIYEGVWVGLESEIPHVNGIRQDVVKALRDIRVPVIRWPGGCFADEYHWMDGIGPRESRPSIFNSHWGGVVENNHFGTHEFFELCEQVGADAYVCGNVGSGTVREMSQWVEYMTSPAQSPMADLRRSHGRENPWSLKYFGVGNENWGCGGNMRAEFYNDLYRQYGTYVRQFGSQRVQKIAGGANVSDYHWTETLMSSGNLMDGLSLHNYTLNDGKWPPSGSATEFDEMAYLSILKAACNMETLVRNHSEIMDRTDPNKRVNLVVDEWGTWFPVEPGTNPGFLYQQNTMRDALVASVHFDIFHRHCDRVRMTNIAQMVNVLQAMVLTDNAQMILTPTYLVFWLYQHHMDAKRVDVKITSEELAVGVPTVSATASESDRFVTVSASNLHYSEVRMVEVHGLGGELVLAEVLAGEAPQSHNTFASPEAVRPRRLDARLQGNVVEFEMPAASIASLRFSV
jgi:alpha-N-arabinofuranosidase